MNPLEINTKSANCEQDKPFTVFVEGNIGSGKTSFLSYFNDLHSVVYSEPTDIWRNIRGHNVLVIIFYFFEIENVRFLVAVCTSNVF